jgi:hypothetical protein
MTLGKKLERVGPVNISIHTSFTRVPYAADVIVLFPLNFQGPLFLYYFVFILYNKFI